MGLRDAFKRGLTRSREALNEVFYMGGEVDEDFWEELEDTLVMADMGGEVAMSVADDLRDQAARENLRSAHQLKTALSKRIAKYFPDNSDDPFSQTPSCVLFVGINGAGKTTTVGKLAEEAKRAGRKPIIGGADTFRAAAIEQLQVWGQRSGVEVVTRQRGSDPASICYDVCDVAEKQGDDLILIDTAGRLHTSAELMRELSKVVNVTRKRCSYPVKVCLVVDATTGQNGLSQAHEFNNALDLDGLIITKLDGTAKGGIAVAIADQLKLPIWHIGVGEGLEDLQKFNAQSFCDALVGVHE